MSTVAEIPFEYGQADSAPRHPTQDLIEAEYERSLGKKLGTIEALRVELKAEGIQCPGVLVVGEQSAGKSSVLERLTGIAFPRAANTCTKVPAIVQLQTDSSCRHPKTIVSKCASFSEGCIECSSMEDLQRAILSFTSELINDANPIQDRPIHIRYTRASGPVMTLIDLPGITHVNTSSNEKFDMHEATASMVRKYVQNENMIVLVVIPANNDFGNAEAVNIAQAYDKDGIRTIGVVSKCDLVPEKSDIIQKIRMTRENDVKLALGFIAVRNRGIDEEALDMNAAEEELFSCHTVLRELRPEERGFETLSRKIVELQGQQVDRFIPEVKELVRKRVSEISHALDELEKIPCTPGEKRAVLSQGLCEIDAKLIRLIRAEDISERGHNISARSYELAVSFAEKILGQIPNFLGEDMQNLLKEKLIEKKGYTLPNFLTDSVFREVINDTFFRGLLERSVRELIDDTVTLVHSVIVATVSGEMALVRFGKVYTKIKDTIGEILDASRHYVENLTTGILEAEKVQTFTQNPLYSKTILVAERVMLEVKRTVEESGETTVVEQVEDGENGEQEKTVTSEREIISSKLRDDLSSFEAGLWTNSKTKNSLVEFVQQFAGNDNGDQELPIKGLQVALFSYSSLIIQRLCDVIPMVTFNALIHQVQRGFHRTVQEAFTDEMLEKLMAEDVKVQMKRRRLELRLVSMKKAMGELDSLI